MQPHHRGKHETNTTTDPGNDEGVDEGANEEGANEVVRVKIEGFEVVKAWSVGATQSMINVSILVYLSLFCN